MRKLKWILLSVLGLLVLAGCVHKTLSSGPGPGPGPEPGPGPDPGPTPPPVEETVHIFVECTNVKNIDRFGKGTFVLSNLYASKDSKKGKIPFPVSVQDESLKGDVISYGHCPEGETCQHILTAMLTDKDGKLKYVEFDVSSQMQAQRDANEIHLFITNEIDMAEISPVEPPVPGEEGVVHIFVRCLHVKNPEQLNWAAFAMSNLRSQKDGKKETLPFAASLKGEELSGDILSYGHCAPGETCQHTLTILATLTDGSQKVLDIDVSAQVEAQRDAPIINIVITDVIDWNHMDPPVPGDDNVHIYVVCTNIRQLDRIVDGTFSLSNLYPEAGGGKTTLPFPASVQDKTIAGNVVSHGHCPSGETCQHTLTLMINMTDGGQRVMDIDVSAQMQAQRDAKVIFLIITEEVNPEIMVDFENGSSGGIKPLDPSDDIDVS